MKINTAAGRCWKVNNIYKLIGATGRNQLSLADSAIMTEGIKGKKIHDKNNFVTHYTTFP